MEAHAVNPSALDPGNKPLECGSTDSNDWLLCRGVRHKTSGETSGQTLSVVTYNILSDTIRRNYDYSYTDETYLQMVYRHSRIMEEVKHYDADVVCLQEVDEDYYCKTLNPSMQRLGYEGHYLKKVKDSPDGSATFYKSDVFSLLSFYTHSYYELACQDVSQLPHSDEVKDCLRKRLNRPAILLVTSLRHTSTGKSVVIGNTHITYMKYNGLDIKAAQVAYAFKTMARYSENGQLPFVLCGDFNTSTTDPGYLLARDGRLGEQGRQSLQASRELKLPDSGRGSLMDLLPSAFEHPVQGVTSAYHEVEGKEPVSTTKNGLMEDCVDYIWSSCLSPLSVTQVNPLVNPLPDDVYPSDHISLQATFQLL